MLSAASRTDERSVCNTKDLLLSVNVPTITGFTTAFKNIGEMENKGWEFALTTRNLVRLAHLASRNERLEELPRLLGENFFLHR